MAVLYRYMSCNFARKICITGTFIRQTLFSHQPLFKVSLKGGCLTQVSLHLQNQWIQSHESRYEWVSGEVFSYVSTKTYIVGSHQKRLTQALLMSTHKICFHGEIIKNINTFLLKKKKKNAPFQEVCIQYNKEPRRL